jgi:hypothetical protein
MPAGKMVDCFEASDTTGSLQGICPDCNRMIYRRINPQKLAGVRGDLEVTITRAGPRLRDTVKPNVNCDSAGGQQT